MELRKLKKSIEKQFSISNGFLLAQCLCAHDIYELSEEHKKIILYLQKVCDSFSFDDYSLAMILSHDSYEDVVKKVEQYRFYTGEEKCSTSSLSISQEQIEEYKQYLIAEGFKENEFLYTMACIIKMGCIVKCIDEMKKTTNLFSLFDISQEERNHFISQNADFVYNDFSRNVESLFMSLINKYGKTEGFHILIQHPEIIHFGMNTSFNDNPYHNIETTI